uniref:Cyclic nucleotide-binding domain-containing protein n=1 Tax=Timema cristinae TaxID=61476 RepID=A0A7R9CTE1_TIMCR|nr:unnamed protein product [Timema cristinae]
MRLEEEETLQDVEAGVIEPVKTELWLQMFVLIRWNVNESGQPRNELSLDDPDYWHYAKYRAECVILPTTSLTHENTAVEQNLLKRIVAAFRLEIYVANDTIVREGDLGNTMYFIHTGSVAVYSPGGIEIVVLSSTAEDGEIRGSNLGRICHLEDGDQFGEIALVMEDERRRASVVAIETSKLFRLSREDFRQAMKPYPETMAMIKESVFKRLAFNLKLDEELSKK